MQQKEAIWQELERFSVVYGVDASLTDFAEDISSVFELVGKRTNADKPHAIASVMMRHAAFVYVSQLYMLSKYRMKWSGDNSKIGLADRELNGRWAPQWVFPEGSWISVDGDEQAFSALQRIMCHHCRTLVKAVAMQTKSSPIVLWENIWGYVLWMYVQLFQESGEASDRARHDLEQLLKNDIWQGMERQSPFQKFLNGLTPEESMANYARVTCCLYYLIPGHKKCSYCPKLSNDKCLQ
jgi:ferric iron reductase protein FhuF